MDSLISECEFLKNVERHIQAAGGLEKRIRRSIERTAAAAGIDPRPFQAGKTLAGCL